MHAVKVHEILCRIFPDDSPCRGCLNTLVKQRVIKLTPNVGAFMKLNYAVRKGNRNNRMAESVHSSMALPTIKGNDYPVNRAGVN